jgi:flagellar basal-body rod protein FlgB
VLNDVTSSVLQVALSGLSARQRTIANNVANIETPGFHAGRVSFESALQSALADGKPVDQVETTTAQSTDPTRLDGNNVNLDDETISNVDTGLRYQLVLRALDSKYNLLHDVIKG